MAAQTLAHLGDLAMTEGEIALAQSRLEESLDLTRKVGDQRGSAAVLNLLGVLARKGVDYSAARSAFEESVAICRRSGDRHVLETVLRNLVELEEEASTHSNDHVNTLGRLMTPTPAFGDGCPPGWSLAGEPP
jgi:uncharacterized protein HemY